MDLLKAQLDRLQKQLAGLNSSQKMLTASLLAIMVMTLIWWGRYAGEPEMTPVLDQSFTADDITRITADLSSRNIAYSISGDRVLVPIDRKMEVLASLGYSHLLPRDTSAGFQQMLGQMNPLQPDDVAAKMFNHAKEMTLSQIIENFPEVASADVLIDPTREIHVQDSVDPSATITISMRDGVSASEQLVNAAADVVQGAQSGLDRSKIKVVVGGVPRRLHDAENNDLDGTGSDALELAQKAEVSRENRIKDYLSYIPDLKVFVTVKVNSTWTQEQRRDFDGKKAVQKETETTNDSVESTNPGASSSAEPGVVSNAGLAIPGAASAGGGGSTSTETKDTAKFQNFVPETDTTTKTPAGDVSVVAATVRVPEAYFAAIYARQNPNMKDPPTEAELAPLITAELPKIRTDVMKCTGLTAESDVAVETYVDVAPIMAAAPQTTALSVTNMVGVHSKELTLGGLALMSLFMVSMMVRKGTPALVSPVPAAVAPGAAAPATLGPEESLAGEAADGRSLLAGMELDEDAVRNQQMLDQVSSMVKENPDAAASLVKRWLNRT
jgi:flagellar biosynthesis/type III secretory pathway M-ring protein FliF/YscJ